MDVTRPKVLDFGIAKLTADEGTVTNTSSVVGTPEYLSPEQARGSTDVDARSDQYALGTILYECVTGQRPYRGSSVLQVVYQVAAGNFPPPSALVEGLPAGFETVLLRAMSPQPRARFRSVDEFARALLPFAKKSTRAMYTDEG
jgi:serine/threonine-protein kinase